MSIVILGDARPGHVNQARGVAMLLASPGEPPATELTVQAPRWRLRLARRLLALPRGKFTVALLRALVGMPPLPAGATLALSAGADTLPFLALATAAGRRTVFTGSLRRTHPGWVSLVMTLEPQGTANNLVVDFTPMPLDPATAAAAGADYLRARPGDPGRSAALLVGGDAAGVAWGESDWQRLAAIVEAISAQTGLGWRVTTSRRTGAASEAILRRLLSPARLIDTAWHGDAPRPVVRPWLGLAERVVVTADSTSMIMEAVNAGHVPLVFRPERAFDDARMDALVDRLAAAGLAVPVRTVDDLPAALAHSPSAARAAAEAGRARVRDALRGRLGIGPPS